MTHRERGKFKNLVNITNSFLALLGYEIILSLRVKFFKSKNRKIVVMYVKSNELYGIEIQRKRWCKVQKCDGCKVWKEKEVYYDDNGNVTRKTFSKKTNETVVRKLPLKIDVRIGKQSIDDLIEISKKVDELRNEHPFTEAHFTIEC